MRTSNLTLRVHRTRRGPMLQIDVARCCLPIRLVRDVVQVPQPIPFGLGRQPNRFARLVRQPVAESLGLQIVHLGGPIPRHVDDLGHRPEAEAVRRIDPEQRVPGLREANPFPALMRPELLLFVAAVFDKAQVFPVRNQIAAGGEVPDLVFLTAEFIIPAVQRVSLDLPSTTRPPATGTSSFAGALPASGQILHNGSGRTISIGRRRM